jgi:transposase
VVDRLRKEQLKFRCVRREEKSLNMVAAAVKVCGGTNEVARKLGVSRKTVYRWVVAGNMKTASYKHVAALSKLSGVPIEQLGGE